jgi:RHS repeat-associated protein
VSNTRRLRAVTAVVSLSLSLALAGSFAQAYAAPAATGGKATGAGPTSAVPGNATPSGDSADVTLDAWGDGSGYHLDVGRGSANLGWREVAVLKPAGLDESGWTGYQCVSGDGRFAAVAVAPLAVMNLQSARDRGGFAYSVNLSTGKVVAIASGVALKYFSPGCGIADQAAFTVSLGSNEERTEVISASLATGAVTQSVTVAGQVTSTVPTAAGLVGAMGSHLVRLPAGSTGEPTLLAPTGGDVYDLHPTADGGVSFLNATANSGTATAGHEKGGKLTRLATGPLTRLQLFGGRAGHTVLSGSISSDPAANAAAADKVVLDAGLAGGASTASLDGTVLLGDPPGQHTDPQVLLTSTRTLSSGSRPTSTVRPVVATAGYHPPGVLSQPAEPRQQVKLQPRGDTAYVPPKSATPKSATPQAGVPGTATPGVVTPNIAQTPTCAVPRLDQNKQVMQPSPAQVNWAAQLAEQGLLTAANGYSRPAGWDNLGLVAYAPSDDFAPIPLSHPSGSTTSLVPRSVYEAIMAQESNFSQASWHAPKGMAGDPLIADYYGAGGDIVSINYAGADCGYGIGQVTAGMRTGDTQFSAHGQIKIAVDYQENMAAGLQILESTWNQLYAAGITANGGDPKYLENWYFAIWAYNSGIQPNAANGNTTGCTPGPSCTGPDGTWGMGWSNNPENPDYPPSRLPYLQATYADAAHPSSWPYQERVLGWMASPIQRYNAAAYSPPTYHGVSWVQPAPFTTMCSISANHCDPNTLNSSQPDAGHCQLDDYECWWHAPVTWISTCSTTCTTSSYEVSGGSEPSNPSPNPPTCGIDNSVVASNAIIVDDQSSPPTNLQGCGNNYTSNGTFSMHYGTNSNGDPIGAIDVHQLGAGLGGHILFTHTEDGSNANLINTGTWTPNLPSLQYYKIKLHLPALGADATNVIYTVNPGGGASPWKIRVNQAWNTETWVTIGTFAMQNGGTVVLDNRSTSIPGSGSKYSDYDVGFDGIAFIPEGGTPGTPIGGPPGVQDEPKGSNPAWVQCGCGKRTAGDPVDTSTGYFGDTFTDLSTPGRGMPLNFTRSYAESTADPAGPNGSAAVNGPFGYGWTFSYNLKAVTNATTGAVAIVQEDGSQVAFSNASGVYTTVEPRNDATLTKSGTTYTYTRRGHDIFLFDTATGHLTAEQDLAGAHAPTPYKTTLAYNSSGQLSTITDPGGRVYTLTWTSGHITQLKDGAGQTVSYSYDASNDLTDVLGVGTTRSPSVLNDDHMQFAYNTTTHLMTSMRTPKNYGGAATAVTAMTYDSAERVLTQTDALGRVTTFNYGPSSTPSLTAGQTLVTDPSGHKTLDSYANGLLTSETKGYGTSAAATTSYTYDPVSLGVSTESDPNGNLLTFSYDDHGNRISSSDADGRTTNYSYDAADDLTEVVDPMGVATVNVYDQAGHISTGTGTTNSGTFTWGDVTSSTVTLANNIVESVTGNFGPAPTRTTNYYYDTAADPADRTRSVDPGGFTTTMTYDSVGDLVSSTDPLSRKTLHGYDTARGWLTSTVAPTGTAAGVLATCTPPAAGCTTYTHDLYGNTTVTTDPLGHTEKSAYDADGNKISDTDGNNNTTAYTFDAADQAVKTTRPDSTTEVSTYNGDGTLYTVTDPGGFITTHTYDAQGRAVTVTNPDSRVTTTNYDAAGHVISSKDAAGAVTTNTIDPAGQVTAISYSDGVTPNITGISYDADGRKVSMTDGTGTSSWSFDTFGELTSSVNGVGATTTYGYDSRGDETSIKYPDAKTVTNGYDNAGQLSSVKDAASNTSTFGYTADGENSTISYPNSTKVTNAYNNADQQTGTTLTSGSTTLGAISYGRDNEGQVSSRTPSGSIPGTAQTYTYTAMEQVKSDSTGSFSYDGSNNPTGITGATQKFDSAGQLCWSTTAAVTGTPGCTAPPSGSTGYTFNADGERTASTPATGTASSFAYNQSAELTSATTPSGSGIYAYDGNGLRTSKKVGSTTTQYSWGVKDSNNVLLSDGTTDYVYGPGGIVIEQTSSSAVSYLVHDQLGSTVALTSSAGAVSGGYSYSTVGKVLSHTGTVVTPIQYGDGYTDAETGLVYLQARYYDAGTDQFLTIDPALASTMEPYAYVDDNPLNRIDPFGLSWYNPTTWSKKTWEGVGVGLGAVALAATGVGLVAELGTAATIGVSALALGSGAGATYLDYGPCVHEHVGLACGGLIMGAAGLLYGGVGAAFDIFGAGETAEMVATGLNIQSMLLGGTGTLIDGYGLAQELFFPTPEQKLESKGGPFGEGTEAGKDWECAG